MNTTTNKYLCTVVIRYHSYSRSQSMTNNYGLQLLSRHCYHGTMHQCHKRGFQSNPWPCMSKCFPLCPNLRCKVFSTSCSYRFPQCLWMESSLFENVVENLIKYVNICQSSMINNYSTSDRQRTRRVSVLCPASASGIYIIVFIKGCFQNPAHV